MVLGYCDSPVSALHWSILCVDCKKRSTGTVLAGVIPKLRQTMDTAGTVDAKHVGQKNSGHIQETKDRPKVF